MTEMSVRGPQLRVLGPMECTAPGPAGLGGPRQRLVLAVLLARVDEVVPADTLLDTLWAEQVPDDARHTLQVFVSRLRRALHPVGCTLAWQESGYVLTTARHQVDAHQFEDLVDAAVLRNGSTDDRDRRRTLLAQALDLWRGRPFGDLGDHPALVAERDRLAALRLRATEARIDLDLSAGQHEELLPELHRLTGEHPLTESLWLRLVLALHRCGRRTEALAVYDRMRRTLSQELGVDPSRALQQAHKLLLDDDPRLDTLAPPLLPVDDPPPAAGSFEVYRLVAEGRLHFDRKTEDDFARAAVLFRRAIELDPRHVPAWLGLAESLALTADYGYGDRGQLMQEAERAVAECLALRPSAAEAHVARGLIAEARFDAPAAYAAYARVAQLVPAHADAHSWKAWIALTMGRPHEALPAARRAVQLNPLSAEAVSNLALALLAGGDPVTAHAEALRAEALSPGFTTARYYTGLALYDQGRFEEAVETLLPLATTPAGVLSTAWAGHGPDTALALSQVAAGDVRAARATLALIDPQEHPVEAGLVLLGLDDLTAAVEMLDRPVRPGYGPAMLFHLHFPSVWQRLERSRGERLAARIRRSWNVGPPW